MPRPPKWRKISFLPNLTYFKPAGVPLKKLEEVCIEVEELEAVRLKDLEGLDQENCANQMGISRATFHRIINAARAKIASALVEGKAIRLSKGQMTENLLCQSCGIEINLEEHQQTSNLEVCPRSMRLRCPFCGKKVTAGGPPEGPHRERNREGREN